MASKTRPLTGYTLISGGITKLLPLREKFHVTDIVVQVLPSHLAHEREISPNATISDGHRYLPARFIDIDEKEMDAMYFGVYKIKLALFCPILLEDFGLCNTLFIQNFEKCTDPLSGIVGRIQEDLVDYEDERFPVEDVVPIALLALFPKSIALPPIRARVTYKSRLYDPHYSHLRRPCFVIHLMDKSSEIRVIVQNWRNELAEEIYDRFQGGKIYCLSNLTVIGMGPYFRYLHYSNLKNEMLLAFTKGTVIEECAVDTDTLPYTFNLSTIPQLHQMELDDEGFEDDQMEKIVNCSVDVIGIVSETSLIDDKCIYKFAIKAPFRHITIFDQSRTSLPVTLWSHHAEEFTARRGDIIAIRNAHLVDFPSGTHKGTILHRTLSVVAPSTIHVEPDIEECFALRHWHDSVPSEALKTYAGPCKWESYKTACE